MPVQLPLVPSIADYTVGVSLAGAQFSLRVRWNARVASWFMDVLDATGAQIRSGIALVLGTWLGRTCQDERFPKGSFQVQDTSGQGRDATFEDLGTRVVVWFWTNDELLQVFEAP